MTTHAPDNGASFAGRYGLSNPTVAWLINSGFGELVALRPEEMQQEEKGPMCPSPTTRYVDFDNQAFYTKDEHCPEKMLWRGADWVCYRHDEPVRRRRMPRLQEIPLPPFSTFDVIGKEVSLEYSKQPWEAKASWRWLVDGSEWL